MCQKGMPISSSNPPLSPPAQKLRICRRSIGSNPRQFQSESLSQLLLLRSKPFPAHLCLTFVGRFLFHLKLGGDEEEDDVTFWYLWLTWQPFAPVPAMKMVQVKQKYCAGADIDGSESTLGILGRVDSLGASAVPHLPSSLQVMIAQAKNSLKHLLLTLLGFKIKDFYCNCFLPSAAAVRLERRQLWKYAELWNQREVCELMTVPLFYSDIAGPKT